MTAKMILDDTLWINGKQKIAHLPLKNTMTDEQLHMLERRFGVTAREGYLK